VSVSGCTISGLLRPETEALKSHPMMQQYKMLGIYHGTLLETPAALDFSGGWLPNLAYFQPSELLHITSLQGKPIR